MLRKLLFFSILWLTFLQSKSSHFIAGADISYINNGGGSFKVILKLYRDCSGSSLGATVNLTMDGNCPGPSSQVLTLNLDSVNDVSRACTGVQTTCDNGTSPYLGIQEYVYSKIIFIPPMCSNVTFTYDVDARINMSSYDNLKNNPDGNSRAVYNKAYMHQDGNNGVYFDHNPILYACNGEINNYNLGAVDSDGDSLSYEIVQTKADGGIDIPFETGYSLSNPFAYNNSPFQPNLLNQVTGQLSFIPTQTQKALITIKVKEYERGTGVLRGEVLRDILIVSNPCSNEIELSGIDFTSSYTKNACYNEPFCFNVYGISNPDSLVTLSYVGSIPGATFSTFLQGDSTIGTFCWNPGTAVGEFDFTIFASANVCPFTTTESFNYKIIIDTTLPNNSVCKDTTLNIGYGGVVIIDSTLVFDPTLNFVCGVDSVRLSQYSYDCSYVGLSDTIMVTTYVNGIALYCQSIIHVIDNIAPVINCTDTVGYIGSTGYITIDTSFVVNSVSDNCGVDSVYITVNQISCTDPDSNYVWVFAQDVFGNIDSCQALVVVRDTTPPVASCKNTTIYLNTSGIAVIDSSFVNDSSYKICGGIQQINLSKDTFGCVDLGVNQVVMYVIDNKGNVDSCVASVTVLDTNSTSVFANCKDTIVYLNNSGSFTIDSSYINDSSYAICGLDGIKLSQYTFNCSNIGVNQVALYLEVAGNYVDSCIAQVTVLDTTPPVANCKNVTVYLNAMGNVVIDSATVDNGSIDNCSNFTLSLSNTMFNCFDTGLNLVSVYLEDLSGNKDTCISQVVVKDTIKPTALCKDTTIYLNSMGTSIINSSFIDAGSNKPCIGINSLTPSKTNFSCLDIGVNTIQLLVLGNNGNSKTCSSMVTVLDTLKPQVNCRDTLLYLDSMGNRSIDSSIIIIGSIDNCGIVSNTLSKYTFNCADVGINPVQLTVYDVSGNFSTCTSNITIMDTLVYPVNAGHDTVFCSVYQFNLYAQAPPSNLIGTWRFLNGPSIPTFVNINNPTTQISNLVAGEYNIEWKVGHPSSCKERRDTLKITIYGPPVSNAGPNQSLCYTSQTTLNGNAISSPFKGEWRQLSGPVMAIITDSSLYNTTVTGMPAGNYSFEWLVFNPVCSQYKRDTINIIVNTYLISDAGSDQAWCDSTQATLQGNIAATGIWSVDNSFLPPSVPNFINAADANTQIINLVEGRYSLVWTIFNGVCPPSHDTVEIHIFNQPIANAGADSNLCDVFSFPLYGNQPLGSATGEWTIDSSFVSPSTPFFSDSSQYNCIISNLVEGNYRLVWTQRNGPCFEVRDTVELHVWNRPVVQAGIDSGLCGVYHINLFATYTPYPGSWTLLSGSPPGALIINPTQANSMVTGLSEGSYAFEWRVTNGPCFDIRDTVVISVYDSVKAIVGADQAFCFMPSTTVNAVPLIGTATGMWKLASSTPNIPMFNQTNSTTVVGNLQESGLYELYWEAINGVCPISRDTILIETFAIPHADFELDTTDVCVHNCIEVINNSTIHPNDSIINYIWRYGIDEVYGDAEQLCFDYLGVFDVRMIAESKNGCYDTMLRTSYVNVFERPTANFDFYLVADPNTSTKIAVNDLSNGAISWHYEMGDGFTYNYSEFVHEYNDSGFYDIVQTITNQWGCSDTITKTAYIHILLVYVPNAFTLNGDGLNETLKPYVSGDDPLYYRFQIFNRWGNLLFETDDKTKAWDGNFKDEPSPAGMYNWNLTTKYKDAHVIKEYKGSFFLIK